MAAADTCNVRVYARFRPLNKRELALGEGAKNTQFKGSTDVTVEGSPFTFDEVFGLDAQQANIYKAVAVQTVDDLFDGFNGTIFAYGQTGAGKSFSMMGALDDDELRGIIPRATRHIFEKIDAAKMDVNFKVSVSYLEVYREVIRDLLDTSNSNLAVRESKSRGTYVDGCATVMVASEQEVFQVLQLGDAARAVAATNMNAHSSRSHSVLILKVEQQDANGAVKTGVLNLVDLAGSERAGKTGASGQTMEEAKKINQSLSALSNVISALAEGKPHIPFRDSKLTRMLQQSLGGNCKTALVVACSPHDDNSSETLSTLRFGARAKAIKTKVKVNEQKSVAELTQLVEMLRADLAKSKDTVSKLKAALEAAGVPLPDLGAATGTGDSDGGDAESGDGGGMSARDAAAYEKLQLEYRSTVEDRDTLRNELTEARTELSATQADIEKNSDTMAEFMKRREGELAIAKRMAQEVVRLREESARKDQLALEAVKIIKTLQAAAKEAGGGSSAASAEASAMLQQEEEERSRAAAEAAAAAAAEIEEKNAEIAQLKASLAEKDGQLEQKDVALKKAVASGQKELHVTQASKMYSSAARLAKVRGQGGARMTQLMEQAAASKALGGRSSTAPATAGGTRSPRDRSATASAAVGRSKAGGGGGQDFMEMLRKQKELASGTSTATGETKTGRGAQRRASLDALFQSSQAAAIAAKASAEAAKAAEAGTVDEGAGEEDEEEEEGDGQLTIGDRIDDALGESYVDGAAIEALLREAKANKCSHPGLNALESKLEGLSAAEPGPEPEPEPAEEEGVPPE
jgi:kinesin family protein 5